ncbi:nucleotide pyrophosphatase [Phycicoccus sp. Root563]|uniref:alkaline phosphatase family protein n=1 Tax=Phycicoccus sp. Root563 TaxID=1736562 RepID=UPI0007034F91|nr:nucleotide pyrophosphatase/phosphodiesterase family protein [Phycicoccus sp. Root563]KQZ88583.1 nucleotide pyrophosphatase [Phycicoccus sp. Root563]
MPHEGLLHPRYDAAGLAGVLPAVAATLGVDRFAGALADSSTQPTGPASTGPDGLDEAGNSGLAFGPSRRAVVVLVDGLGYELIRRRGGHAPFLRSLLPAAYRITAGFPSTTATSMGTFGTGLPPGSHGLLGYEVLVPGEDRLVNQLSWEDGPDPLTWQPQPTVFEQVERAGVSVTRIGPGFFDGSGLTRAALRGGRFKAADTLESRVDASVAAVRASKRSLVYLYWGELDKVGHVHGCQSWEWGDELEAIDAELARLCRSVPSDTAVYVTADHGMVDAPHALRIDLAHDPELAAGVRHVGGEARALQLYCEDGAAADVEQVWVERVRERAWIRSREEAIREGWFGPVSGENLARIGDVVVAMRDNFAIVDSRRARPELLALVGLHGSLTADESAIPLFHVPARDTA